MNKDHKFAKKEKQTQGFGSTLTFRPALFVLAMALFLAEVFIARYVNDRIIRPYIGDYLVVIFLYSFVMAFVRWKPVWVAVCVLLFAYLIEFMQFLRLVSRLGLSENKLARTILGTSFGWLDMLAYTLGIATVLLWHYVRRGHHRMGRPKV